MMSEAEADKIVEEDRKIQKEKEGKSKLLKPSSISDDSNNNGENNSE